MGGSIDKYYDLESSKFIVGNPAANSILQEANIAVDYVIEEVTRKDSLEITKLERDLLVEKVMNADEKRIIIIHGTDTMADTARRLKTVDDKVIVLTGAMQPAAFKNTDADFNLGGAFIAVQYLEPGVYILMNGRVFDPENIRKNTALKQFETVRPEE